MDRVNKIINHKNYIRYVNKIKNLEIDRTLCLHTLQHFIDTCRIMYIFNLENSLDFQKDIIYACGLLHDIGRWQQYEDNIPHEIASSNLAEEILKDCDFNTDEITQILKAIQNHRNKTNEVNSLSELLYMSDKLSRLCFKCTSQEECNWSDEKKNFKIKY